MKSKQKAKSGQNLEMVYHRFDSIVAIEGPYPPLAIHRLLTEGTCTIGAGGPILTVPGAPYRNVPFETLGNIALISKQPTNVMVFNGLAHVSQPLLVIYGAAGTITESEIARFRQGEEYLVDWAGRFDFHVDADGKRLLSHLTGQGKPDIVRGKVMVVCAAPNQPRENRFDLLSPSRWSEIEPLDPRMGIRNGCSLPPGSQQGNFGAAYTILVDPLTGAVGQNAVSERSMNVTVGNQDHVVIVGCDQDKKGFACKGTKADMLEDGHFEAIISQKAPDALNPMMLSAVLTSIERLDPSVEMLFVFVNPLRDPKLALREIAWAAMECWSQAARVLWEDLK